VEVEHFTLRAVQALLDGGHFELRRDPVEADIHVRRHRDTLHLRRHGAHEKDAAVGADLMRLVRHEVDEGRFDLLLGSGGRAQRLRDDGLALVGAQLAGSGIDDVGDGLAGGRQAAAREK
jgi:hypothetical protein